MCCAARGAGRCQGWRTVESRGVDRDASDLTRRRSQLAAPGSCATKSREQPSHRTARYRSGNLLRSTFASLQLVVRLKASKSPHLVAKLSRSTSASNMAVEAGKQYSSLSAGVHGRRRYETNLLYLIQKLKRFTYYKYVDNF